MTALDDYIPKSPRFDLATHSIATVTKRAILSETTGIQGICFRENASKYYATQVIQGGRIIPGTGEGVAKTHAQRAAAGDTSLGLYKLDGTTTSMICNMYLMNYGHCQCIGWSPSDPDYTLPLPDDAPGQLWVETDAAVLPGSTNGAGRQIATFPYVNGASLGPLAPEHKARYAPGGPGAYRYLVTCDLRYRTLALMFTRAGSIRIQLYKLADALNGDFSAPLSDIPLPSNTLWMCPSQPLQGMTTYGRYFYLSSGWPTNPKPGCFRLACFDWETGALKQIGNMDWFMPDMLKREPEGICTRLPLAANPAADQFVFSLVEQYSTANTLGTLDLYSITAKINDAGDDASGDAVTGQASRDVPQGGAGAGKGRTVPEGRSRDDEWLA